MKKLLTMLLTAAILLSLCACELTLPTEPAEPGWQPYNGTMEGYEYYHESDRERKWEEDVLILAQDFADNYPLFQPGKTHMYYYAIQGLGTTIGYLYDEQLRADFFARINKLIPKLGELTNDQIQFELRKIVASLGDVHSHVYADTAYYFWIQVEPFFVEDQIEYRAVVLPSQYKHMLYAQLLSINDIAIEEIIERLTPYGSVENEYGLLSEMLIGGGGLLYEAALLVEIGVLESETEAAAFKFQTSEGEICTVHIKPHLDTEEVSIESRSVYHACSYSFQYWNEENFWYEILEEENTAFVRINRFMEEEDETIKEMFEKLMASLREHENVTKVIVDLRRNGGGNLYMEGYARLLQALKLPQIEKVCVLIDHGTFSQSVVMAYEIKQEIDTAVIMGVPAGEGSFFIGVKGEDPTLPYSGLTYRVAVSPLDLNRDEPFDALLPDVLVYPDLQDYKNGIDTILEAAKDT